jgi:glutamine synthetase adenylyltransferase
MTRIVVLTEEALATLDVEHIIQLHPDAEFRVLVPADTERNLLASIVDHLSLGELREALDEALRREPPVTPELTAAEQLERSLGAFTAAGATAVGEVVDDDPLPALRAAVAEADEVLVVTTPHALEDTFHTDWASRAREELHVPVMHLYGGTNQLG